MTSVTHLLSVTGLSKSYSSPVLTDAGLQFFPGEVHALVGENGAGKSTLARIIAGITKPDGGEMTLLGVPFCPASRLEAEALGVRMVIQELNLMSNLSVAENLFFGHMPHRYGWINYRQINALASEIMREMGLGDVDVRCPVSSLGMGQQQLVEIAAGLSRRARLLILDEPTAALTQTETERLFARIEKLKAGGVAIIYISHRLEEIQRIAERITVLRDGRVVATRAARELTLPEMVRLMVGRELGEATRPSARANGPVALRVHNLRVGETVRGVSFEVRRGEILGFAGLMGSGRTETMRAVFGADRADSGEIYLHGDTAPMQFRSPRDAVRHGVALVTEDRKSQGLLLALSVKTNITLMHLAELSACRTWIRPNAEQAAASRWIKALQIRCASLDQNTVELSGGNQQKVVIAKWLFLNCNVLIFDEPTRGIDVGAKLEIYALLAELAREGKAVIVVSSDLKELLAICDRISVMSAGRVAATFGRGEWSEEKIMAAALSGYLASPNRAGEEAEWNKI